MFTKPIKIVILVIVLYTIFPVSFAEQAVPPNSQVFDPQMVTNPVEEGDKRQFYQIDLVLFEHRNDSGTRSELWSSSNRSSLEADIKSELISESTMNRPKQAITSSKRMATFNLATHKFSIFDQDFIGLSSQNHLLREEFNRIKRSSRYNIVTYMAWIQPGLAPKQAKNVALYDPAQRNSKELSGNIKIVLSRYLHAKINLLSSREICTTSTSTAQPAKTPNSTTELAFDPNKAESNRKQIAKPEQQMAISIDSSANVTSCARQEITFQQNRKMRSRELHYIDNPGFGILIMITPVNKPVKEPKAQQAKQIDSENAAIDLIKARVA